MSKTNINAESPEFDNPTNLRAKPSQKRAEQNVEKILQVAADLISNGGVGNATTSVIAKKAGIPVGTVYRYFENKEAILSELASRYQAEKDREHASWLPKDAASLSIREYVSLWVDESQDNLRSNDVYRELMNLAVRLPDHYDLLRRSVHRWSARARDLAIFRNLDIADEDRESFLNVWLSAGTAAEEMLLMAESDEEFEALKQQMKVMLIAYLEAYSPNVDQDRT